MAILNSDQVNYVRKRSFRAGAVGMLIGATLGIIPFALIVSKVGNILNNYMDEWLIALIVLCMLVNIGINAAATSVFLYRRRKQELEDIISGGKYS